MLNVSLKKLRLSTGSDHFQGACVYTRAQRSVVGKDQAKAYCKQIGVRFKPNLSPTLFRFGDGTFHNLGIIPERIPSPDGSFLKIYMDVVIADVPMLIGLEVLDQNLLIADNVANLLISKRHNWSLPITRKHGHLYVEWDFKDVFYTKSELRKLHLHFYHPSASKLLNLIA